MSQSDRSTDKPQVLEAQRNDARRASGVEPPRLEPRETSTVPDPEVLPKKTRRRFTKAYKLRILEKADRCVEKGEIGTLLRREGLYSSQLATWRRQRRDGFLDVAERRGRPRMSDSERALQRRNKELERQNRSLEKELKKASAIIDIQKKLCDLLGLNPEENDENMS